MFATCRCTVCSLRTSDPAISRFESPAATRRSTSASRRAERRVSVRRHAQRSSSRNPASARWTSRWSSTAGRCESPLSAMKRALGRSAASSRPRVIGTVRSPRRWSTSAGMVTSVGRRVRRSFSSSSRNAAAVSASAQWRLCAERGDLVAARMRDDQPGEHLGRERPVRRGRSRRSTAALPRAGRRGTRSSRRTRSCG